MLWRTISVTYQRCRSGCGAEGLVGGAGEQGIEVFAGELPLERGGDLLVVGLEGQQPDLDFVKISGVVGVNTLRWTTEKQISTWLSQDAWTGRWISRRLAHRPCSLSMKACPRWDEPLSTIQNTRRADA